MKKYFVTGGEYTSTEFIEVVKTTLINEGPFDSYRAAQNCWQNLSMSHIDNALARFKIITVEDPDRYWIVGGIYNDTKFNKLVSDYVQFGPFDTAEEAEEKWRNISMQYVDNALARFRIEQR